jgi:phospholipid/cholesterol/gamma-HCH transport system permease protein
MTAVREYLDFTGELGLFAWLAMRRAVQRPFEFRMILSQIEQIGWNSLSLIAASGLAVGMVLTLHTRSSLIRFGAEAMIPAVQSLSFFNEIGPLIAALLMAGRVGAGIGAELANMRVTEQLDAVEALSVDSFKLFVVPRIIACMIALPILTVFMDSVGLLGGYLMEWGVSHISLQLYLERAFSQVSWATFLPPTFKTAVFGFIIGLVSSYLGYTTNEGAAGVGRASTNSVVYSSLLVILADVFLVKLIFFFFPDTAV